MAEEDELQSIRLSENDGDKTGFALVQTDGQTPDIIVEDYDTGTKQYQRPVPNIPDHNEYTDDTDEQTPRLVHDNLTEDEKTFGVLPTKRPSYSVKNAKPAARNYSEVFTKRTHQPERMASVPDLRTKLATRSSLSRCGSRVQEGPRIQTEVAADDKAHDFLRCITHNEEKSRHLQEIIDKSRSILQKHKTKSNVLKLSLKASVFDESYKVLKERRTIHITGRPGAGKTHLSLDVMSSFLEEFEDYRPLIIESPFELAFLENTASCLLVCADDLIGNGNSHGPGANGWQHFLKFVTPLIERKRMCFIFTSEGANEDNLTYQTLSSNGLLDNESEICLENANFELTDKEQNKMLTLYSKHFCKPLYTNPKGIEDIVRDYESSVGFPLVCNLVGIGGSADLFSDPYHALYTFVSEQHDYHFSSFFLLVLVLVSEKDCSLLKFQHEHHSTFEKLSDVLKSSTCTHSDVSIGLTTLKRQNILNEEESGDISFTHEIVAAAVLSYVLSNYDKEEVIPLLPVKVINEVMLLPGRYIQNFNGNGQLFKNKIETSTVALRAIVSHFSDILDSKRPSDFLKVASSPIWMLESFVDIVFSVLGFQFFFVEDRSRTPLSVYLVRIGNVEAIFKLVDFMLTKPRQIVSMMSSTIEKTKEEACRCNEQEVLVHLLKLSNVKDLPLVHAAIEGGYIDILKLIWPTDSNDTQFVSKEMLQMACQYGNFEVMKYLFSKLETRLDSSTSKLIEMRRQNSKGETLLHFAALGGNVSIFEFLLDQRCDSTVRTYEGNTVLHIAAMFGRFKMVRFICSRFPELIQEKNNLEFTCAHLAAREGHGDVLQILVSRESNITQQVKGGNTILHLAAANGHSEIINFMLVVCPDQQNVINEKGLMPVHVAIKHGMLEALNMFLKSGTSIQTKTVDKRTFLHLAAYYGKLEVVKYLCTRKPELMKELDIEGNAVGHDAAASGNVPVMKYLIEKGVDPLSRNKFDTTLLHEASFHGQSEMVKYLTVNNPTLLSIVNESGYTVLFGAAIRGNIEILKFLIDNGVEPKVASLDGSTVLHESAYCGKLEVVRYLCTNYPELTEARNSRSYMPCHFAAQEGHLEVLDVLLYGKTTPLPTTQENQTLLHIASFNKMVPVVKYLCKRFPAIISCVDNEGSLATHYAARGDSIEILQLLIDLGINPDSGTNSGSTILHLAAYDGNTNMVKYLCDTFPHLIHVLDSTGYSAVHYAASSGEVPLLLNILQYGIDPLIRSSNGSTLLLKAVYNGKREMVQYLCTEYPELISKTDAFGCNVLHYAACEGNFEIIQYMIGMGVNPESRTNDGHTILHVAAFHGQLELVHRICHEYPRLLNMEDNSGKTAEDVATEHRKTKVVALLRSLHTKDQHETELLSDICCCAETNVCERILRVLGNIICCCRRS
ncbi:alpha-latrocrustotoxin-Lt1a-like [Mercenaria mercenaria]|uniref:alpha-latrocrustotoxin-Lt1a-like n=1 Tax=Mercenaria mercenaria TaxID=6596 RepID=UPI00234F7DC5|nr:alpha-latrocrustotoxin-Lt1a-like [Mercenaria mercenaria]